MAAITGLAIADIERLAREFATVRPALIRLNYGLQRHGGGGMAVRTITCLPAVIGAWRHPGGGAFLSTSKLYPFNSAALERPDLIPSGTRTINMVQLPEALAGELPGPSVRALYVYNANPAAVNPDQARVLQGLAVGAADDPRHPRSRDYATSRPSSPRPPPRLLACLLVLLRYMA